MDGAGFGLCVTLLLNHNNLVNLFAILITLLLFAPASSSRLYVWLSAWITNLLLHGWWGTTALPRGTWAVPSCSTWSILVTRVLVEYRYESGAGHILRSTYNYS